MRATICQFDLLKDATMDRSISWKAAQAAASQDEEAKRMFCDGFICAGGNFADLKPEAAEEAAAEVVILAEIHTEGPDRRAFVVDRAKLYGKQCAEVSAQGEAWALEQGRGWHLSLLRRHGVAIKR